MKILPMPLVLLMLLHVVPPPGPSLLLAARPRYPPSLLRPCVRLHMPFQA